MAQTTFGKFYGNIMGIYTSKSGKVKFINLAEANFSDDRSKESEKFSFVVFERDFDKVKALEDQLEEVRKTSGNPKAALKNQHIYARASMQPGNKDEGTFPQVQLVFVNANKPEPRVQATTEAPVEAPVEEAPKATKKASAKKTTKSTAKKSTTKTASKKAAAAAEVATEDEPF